MEPEDDITPRDAATLSAEEANDIICELSVALAVLAGERLAACSSPCGGHLGPQARAGVQAALAAWHALQDGNTKAVADLAAIEAERAAARERAAEAEAALAVMADGLRYLERFAAGHHGEQAPHFWLHALTVDIPQAIRACLSAPRVDAATAERRKGRAIEARKEE